MKNGGVFEPFGGQEIGVFICGFQVHLLFFYSIISTKWFIDKFWIGNTTLHNIEYLTKNSIR